MPSLSCWTVALALTMAACAGCAAQGRAYPVGYTELYSGPVTGIYSAPHTYYQGHLVYWYGGRWMYRDADTWNYYPTEPSELHRFRTTVRQAPPAPRYVPYRDYQPAQPLPSPNPPPSPAPSPPPSPSPTPSAAPPGERVR